MRTLYDGTWKNYSHIVDSKNIPKGFGMLVLKSMAWLVLFHPMCRVLVKGYAKAPTEQGNVSM